MDASDAEAALRFHGRFPEDVDESVVEYMVSVVEDLSSFEGPEDFAEMLGPLLQEACGEEADLSEEAAAELCGKIWSAVNGNTEAKPIEDEFKKLETAVTVETATADEGFGAIMAEADARVHAAHNTGNETFGGEVDEDNLDAATMRKRRQQAKAAEKEDKREARKLAEAMAKRETDFVRRHRCVRTFWALCFLDEFCVV